MTILHPGLLQLGMLAAAVVLFGHLRYARRRRRLGEFLGGPRGADRLSHTKLYKARGERILLLVLASLMLGLGASEPRSILPPEGELPEPSLNSVVIALDISASMQARDFEPTRLARSAVIVEEFLERVEGTQVGLILFAGKGYTIAPPTEDLEVLEFLLQGIVPSISSPQDPGSLLSAGIRHAITLLPPDVGSAERAIVLVTDGEAGEADGDVMRAVREATDQGITLHAIGVGTPAGSEMTLFRETTDRGEAVLDRMGNPGISRLQEPFLREIAREGGGDYTTGANGRGMRPIVNAVRPPPLGMSRGPVIAGFDLTLLLIGGGLLLLLLDSFLEVWTRPGSRALARRPS